MERNSGATSTERQGTKKKKRERGSKREEIGGNEKKKTHTQKNKGFFFFFFCLFAVVWVVAWGEFCVYLLVEVSKKIYIYIIFTTTRQKGKYLVYVNHHHGGVDVGYLRGEEHLRYHPLHSGDD